MMDIPIENLYSVSVSRIVQKEAPTGSFITPEEYNEYFNQENSLEIIQLPPEYRSKWSVLPKQYEGIYLGESVAFYICYTNDSIQESMTNVNVQVDLQIGKNVNRLKVLSSPNLDSKQCLFEILNFEVKDLSSHNLILTISFNFSNLEPQTIRRFIQYPVLKPIDVKTKCYVNTEYDEVYLEAQFQNLSQLPIQLFKVSLESQYFDVNSSHNFMPKDHHSIGGDDKENFDGNHKNWIFGKVNRLNPTETRQYFFILKLRDDAPKPANKLGKLDIFWFSGLGVKGHIQTSQLDNSHRFTGPLKITIDEIPNQIQCRQIFTMKFRLINTGESPIEPTLHFINSLEQKVLWLGLANNSFQQLTPGESVQIVKKLFPTSVGLFSIPLIKVQDAVSQECYDHRELAFVNIV